MRNNLLINYSLLSSSEITPKQGQYTVALKYTAPTLNYVYVQTYEQTNQTRTI